MPTEVGRQALGICDAANCPEPATTIAVWRGSRGEEIGGVYCSFHAAAHERNGYRVER